MKPRLLFALAFGSITLMILMVVLVTLWLGFEDLVQHESLASPDSIALWEYVMQYGVSAGFFVITILFAVWLLFDEGVAKPLNYLTRELQTILRVNPQQEILYEGPQQLGLLFPTSSD